MFLGGRRKRKRERRIEDFFFGMGRAGEGTNGYDWGGRVEFVLRETRVDRKAEFCMEIFPG